MRVALVTGGSRGIGQAIVLELRRRGCDVATCARNVEGVANGLKCDVTIAENIKGTIQSVIERWGRLDILINNVGGGGEPTEIPFEDAPDAIWLDAYVLNSLAAVRFTMGCLPYMIKQGWGRVITIASKNGKEAGGRPWYTMAKAGEIVLMKTLSLNPRYKGITFNSIAPGPVSSEFTKPEDIAALVAYLCSEEASRINGACIPIDGGASRGF